MAYIYDLTDTWNASGTTFNGIKLNVTDSASASSSKLVTLQTNGTEHFSITKAGVGYVSGNLGVGTSSPTAGYRLQINAGTSAAMISSTTTSAGAIPKLTFLHAGNDEFSIVGGSYFAFLSSGTTERMRIDSSGRLFLNSASGVGNEQMLVAFNSSGSVTQAVNMRDNNASGNGNSFIVLRRSDDTYLGAIGRSGTDSAMFVEGNSYLTLRTGGTERMRINSSGNVGIGVVPSAWSAIRPVQTGTAASFSGGVGFNDAFMTSNAYYDGSNWRYINSNPAYYQSVGGAAAARWYTAASGTAGNAVSFSEAMRIDTSGNLLIGTTATVGGTWSNEVKQTSSGVWPWGLNCVDRGLIVRNSSTSTGYYAYFEYNGGTNNGSISWSGGTTAYNTTSDARIKDNIVDAPDAGDLIDAIQVRSWDFKADGAHWRYGMVAQELLEVAPEAVNKPEDEEMMMGVDYSKLVPMLIKEVQSLRARVAQLEGN